MKIKIAIVVLVLALVALGIALFATQKQSEEQHSTDVKTIVTFSNLLTDTQGQLSEQRQVNLDLTNDLSFTRSQLTVAQEHIQQLSNNLVNVEVQLENTSALLAIAQNQVTNLNVKLADLEWHNKTLEQNAIELTNTIAQLNQTIATTEHRLATEKKNRVYLEKELQKQIAMRTELESKFNNIAEVRAQLRKMRDDMVLNNRIATMKDPTVGKKGAELLVLQSTVQVLTPTNVVTSKTSMTNSAASKKAVNTPDYNLNVEVGNDGSVNVIAPLGSTNPPSK